MKIAYDAKRFFNNSSGLGNYSRDLIRVLAKYYPENTYLLFAKNKTEKRENIMQKESVFFKKLSSGFMPRQLKMGIDAQTHHAEIFHGLSGELPLKWNSNPIKKIVTIHDLIFMRYPMFYPFIDRKIYFWKLKKAVKQADIIIATSKQTKEDIINFLNIPEEKIRVVYQGCHTIFKQEFSSNQRDKIRKKYNLPERFILSVGTIEERKNLLNVIKAIQDSSIPLVMVGKKTAYYKKLASFLREKTIPVYFIEDVSIENLAVLYQLADIFVYTSIFEGFGIPIIESLFSKTPVITSNTSSLPEIGGKQSLYVSPHDIADIRDKILFLWNHQDERKKISEKSFSFVQKFNDQNIAKELMNIYVSLLN